LLRHTATRPIAIRDHNYIRVVWPSTSSSSSRPTSAIMCGVAVHVVLFKPTDLRLHDHAPLCAAHDAAAADSKAVLHLLVLDEMLGFGQNAPLSSEAMLPRLGWIRARFIVESVGALHERLIDYGHELLVFLGRTAEALDAVASVCAIASIYTHGPELCSEEQRIERCHRGHTLRLFWGWTLTHIDDLPPTMQHGHAMPGRYKPFLDAVSKGKGPARTRPPLQEPKWTAAKLPDGLRARLLKVATHGVWGLPTSAAELTSATAVLEDEVATASHAASGSRQRGGEAAALEALRAYVWTEERLRRYVGSSDSMTPGVDNALNATTRLSAYLAHGCLSARRVYHEVRAYEQRRVRNRSTYWVYHELIMRDFLAFSCLTWGTTLFSADGPLASSGHRWRDPADKETRRLFEKWTRGQTGFPFVDAGMRQLAREGWMPHVLRQMCAAFLVRDLRVPWRWGAEWFEQRLVDHTPDANYGVSPPSDRRANHRSPR
jgi:deoxyribodipyrimidine photo-lyase